MGKHKQPHNGQVLGMYRWELYRIIGSIRRGARSVNFAYPYRLMTSDPILTALEDYQRAAALLEAAINRELARVAADPQTVISELNRGYRND